MVAGDKCCLFLGLRALHDSISPASFFLPSNLLPPINLSGTGLSTFEPSCFFTPEFSSDSSFARCEEALIRVSFETYKRCSSFSINFGGRPKLAHEGPGQRRLSGRVSDHRSPTAYHAGNPSWAQSFISLPHVGASKLVCAVSFACPGAQPSHNSRARSSDINNAFAVPPRCRSNIQFGIVMASIIDLLSDIKNLRLEEFRQRTFLNAVRW